AFKSLSKSAQKGFCSRRSIFYQDFITMLKRNGAEQEASLCEEHQKFSGPAGEIDDLLIVASLKGGNRRIKILVDSDDSKVRALEYVRGIESIYKGADLQVVDDRELMARLKSGKTTQEENANFLSDRLTIRQVYFDKCYLPNGAATRNPVKGYGP